MLKMFRIALALGALTIGATGMASAETLKVVASFSIIGDFAKNVGGDRISVTTLVGPDGDAHAYEPKPADAAAMSQADVILVNGLHFEGFLQRLIESSGAKGAVAELTKGVETIELNDEHAHDGSEATESAHDGTIDPHAFQSIANAKIYVKNIADAFCAADMSGCETYRANAATYDVKLDAVEAEVRASIAAIPSDKRVIITSHDAFGYFAHAYGLKFLAPEGVSTEAEASAADVAALITQVRHDKAAAIFVENITNRRLIEQIAAETGLKIGGTLFSDALSQSSGPAGTYIDMMQHNSATIRGAVLGS